MSEAGDRARRALDEFKAALSEMPPDEARLFLGEMLSGLTAMAMGPTVNTSTVIQELD